MEKQCDGNQPSTEHTQALADREQFPPFFEAVLTPHRSLSKGGLWLLLGALGFLSLFYSVFLIALGFWLAPLVLALPLISIWLAFHWNNNDAKAYEHISVSPLEVRIRHVNKIGKEQEFCCNPFRARIETKHDEDQGIISLLLYAEGKVVTIGKFLNPQDRTNFAHAFAQALHTARRSGVSPKLS
ncbi:DUF2244 domain-containing protein [Rhodobacteraceae bacterium RKSG542]|uniref:DUF2244 domain-containing protein n=1 Tax=Pseudovibrio flavus TaxID=2529854 RepID=UPI0012BD13E6|nr:DUF2244 domain-containing protein [Pseudovibrio flavus]MTI18490.1 DUF2244 domain-containing protein [Pseudovibrio flavus]